MSSLAFIVGAYFLGTLPQVYWLRRARARDVPLNGDLHESLWGLSHRLGAIGFAIDLAKGPTPVLVGRWLGFPDEVVALAGVMVVLGQVWPAFMLRSGGGGNSTGMAMAGALAPGAFFIALAAVAVGIGYRVITHLRRGQSALGPPHSRSLPLGMCVAFASLPVSSWLMGRAEPVTLALLGVFVAIMVKRLVKGIAEESAAKRLTARAVVKHLLFD
ncbi:MAG: glycerol-3-phosphate acyltransferase [Chloroflexi bacterium]|nr:glycerol-3-phosphate acyltransferase [Chloroflexota bacterium]